MKLEYLAGGEWQEHSHPPVFKQTAMSDNGTRLIVGVPAGDVEVMRKLAACLEQPYYILYVLLTPRGEENAGRYQSPLVERSQLDLFLTKYAAYLRSDGRFNLWVHSPSLEATLVWDHHNLLYAYGPLAGYEEILRSMGFSPGSLEIPKPHGHRYRPECDADAAAVMSHFDWRHSELRPEDEP